MLLMNSRVYEIVAYLVFRKIYCVEVTGEEVVVVVVGLFVVKDLILS